MVLEWHLRFSARLWVVHSLAERLGRLQPASARRGAWVPWDESHFVCSVYRELNLLLLNMLCDPSEL